MRRRKSQFEKDIEELDKAVAEAQRLEAAEQNKPIAKENKRLASKRYREKIKRNPDLLEAERERRRRYQASEEYKQSRRKYIAERRKRLRDSGIDPLKLQKVIRFANNLIDIALNIPDDNVCPKCKSIKTRRKQWCKTSFGFMCRSCWEKIKKDSSIES